MSLGDELFDLTREALAGCTEQQRVIYSLAHGIDDQGTTTPLRLEAVARKVGLSRSATRWHLAMAEVAIYKHIAQTLIAERQLEQYVEMQGTQTARTFQTYGMSIRTRGKQSWTNVTLGEGSEQVTQAARNGSAETRTARYKQIHERYAREQANE